MPMQAIIPHACSLKLGGRSNFLIEHPFRRSVALLGREKEDPLEGLCSQPAVCRALCAKRFFDDLAVCSCDRASFSAKWLC